MPLHGPDLSNSTTFISNHFSKETEVTGETKLVLHASSTWNDMNIHAALSIIHADGVEEELVRGRLKASHRKLDPDKSIDSRPWLAHDEIQKLEPGVVYPVTIEIWPTSMIFEPGERVKLPISSSAPTTSTAGRHEPQANNNLHLGGEYDSLLQLPIVPAK